MLLDRVGRIPVVGPVFLEAGQYQRWLQIDRIQNEVIRMPGCDVAWPKDFHWQVFQIGRHNDLCIDTMCNLDIDANLFELLFSTHSISYMISFQQKGLFLPILELAERKMPRGVRPMSRSKSFFKGTMSFLFALMGPLVFDPAQAHELELPPVDPTQAGLEPAFAQRQDAVLRFNACGREHAFETYLQELRSGNHEHQGEGMSQLLSAKIQMFYKGGCRYEESMPAQDMPPIRTLSPACAIRSSVDDPDRTGWRAVRTIIDKDCLRQQINQALLAYRRHGQLGSSDVPCGPLLSGVLPIPGEWSPITEGEYDVDVRELMRILYLGGALAASDRESIAFPLERATVNHLWNELLTVRGSPGPESYSTLFDCGNREESLGSPADYADEQAFVYRALDDLGDAGDYLLRRFLLLLALVLLLAPAGVAISLPYGGIPPLYPGIAVATPITITDPVPFARIPETENHLLMIESSRYLTNKAMLIILKSQGGHSNIDVIERQQEETRDWLLQRLQNIAKQDFEEYNSRPYQRYSLNAILNLHDFGDDDIKTAARIILDYVFAKTVVGSNRARRYAPYRRLAENDGYAPDKKNRANFYNRVGGADYGASLILMLGGQTQLQSVPELGSQIGRTPLFAGFAHTDNDGGVGGWVNIATSSYRLAEPIRELSTNDSYWFQRIRHAGVEIYRATPSYLITSGGLPVASANKMWGLGLPKDSGIVLPTTFMPTDGGFSVSEIIRFEGIGTGADRRAGVCLDHDFACGVNLVVGDLFADCKEESTVLGTNWLFINSANCTFHGIPGSAGGRHHFYLAITTRICGTVNCRLAGIQNFGVLEAVDAPAAVSGVDPVFERFKTSRTAALNWLHDEDFSIGHYWEGKHQTWDGRLVDFNIYAFVTREVVGGAWSNESSPNNVENWSFLADGHVIKSSGDGRITVLNPKTNKFITLDYRSWSSPVWSKNY
jgi:hypothetical protein